MSKGILGILIFAVAVLICMPQIAASASPSKPLPPNDLQTRVIQDSQGNVHVLWLVPALNNSATSPGLWYSKYSPNGTDTIPPTQITNSSNIQSADLAVDEKGDALITWSEEAHSPIQATLYILHFNSTQNQVVKVLSTTESLILWPSLTLDNDSSIYMTWTNYYPTSSLALVELGKFTAKGLVTVETIASYLGADAFPPQARVVFDNATQHVQIAWGETRADGTSASTVNYAKLVTNGTILTRLQVARFAATLRDVTISSTGHDGAFVAWQTTESNHSLFVSQISPQGRLEYVKELNDTAGESRYLAVSTDFEGNLYVVWYQPSMSAPQTSTSTPAPSTSVAYLQMNMAGIIVQTGTGIFHVPVIGVTVLNDGVYGVSQDGLVRVMSAMTPTQPQYGLTATLAVALMSCVSVAGFAGSIMTEDGRYRWTELYSRLGSKAGLETTPVDSEVLKLLARKPGMNLRDIRHASRDQRVSVASLVKMEREGSLASFREGSSRRFYIKGTETGQIDALRTRILLWVLEHPDVWEAQVAKDLALSQQIVHYHLKKLRETNLITSRTDSTGIRKLYRCVDGPENEGAG